MRTLIFASTILFACASAVAADPLPATMASAGVTQHEWDAVHAEVQNQVRLRGYSEQVVTQLATEVLQAQPGQSIQTYVSLVRSGASRLIEMQTALRALNPGDNTQLVALRARAVEAADAGRLRDALALQDEYVVTFQGSIQELLDQPYLDLAAAIAASADTAFTLGNYLDAADRFHRAAETAPASAALVRWRYFDSEGAALYAHGSESVMRGRPDYNAIDRGLRVFIDQALPLVPRETHPREWNISAEGVAHLCEMLASPTCGDEVWR